MNSQTGRRPIDYYVLWLVALTSLGLNLYLVSMLLQARRQVALSAGSAAVAVQQLRSTAIDYAVPISYTLPVSFTVAYHQNFTVPVSLTVPIDTVVTVPLNTPLGNFPITVPVKTTVPISLTSQVPLNLLVPVSVTVPISLSVPIHIAVSDTTLGDSLASAANFLNSVAADLGGATPTPTATP